MARGCRGRRGWLQSWLISGCGGNGLFGGAGTGMRCQRTRDTVAEGQPLALSDTLTVEGEGEGRRAPSGAQSSLSAHRAARSCRQGGSEPHF